MMNERGAVTVLTAIFISSIIAGMAIVADIGLLYQEKRQLQTAVDSATLAGTMELAEGGSAASAESLASTYILKNTNVTPDEITFDYPEDDAFQVSAKTTRNMFFAKIFGIDDSAVGASATGDHGVANAVSDLSPIIVPSNSIDDHIGPSSLVEFEFGEDRPLDPFYIEFDQQGSMVTYTISYTNTKNQPVDLTLWSPIAAGASYVDGSATSGGIFDGSEVRWTLNSIAAGDSRIVSYIVQTASNPTATAYASTGSGPNEEASDNNAQRGFFWLVDFDGGSGGVPDYREWIIGGYPELVYIGDLLNGTGMKTSLKDALESRIIAKPEMVLPVFDYTEGGGSQGSYHVVGFVEFIMTEFKLSGNPKTITGYFTDGIVMPGAGGDGAQDFGIQAIWLSE